MAFRDDQPGALARIDELERRALTAEAALARLRAEGTPVARHDSPRLWPWVGVGVVYVVAAGLGTAGTLTRELTWVIAAGVVVMVAPILFAVAAIRVARSDEALVVTGPGGREARVIPAGGRVLALPRLHRVAAISLTPLAVERRVDTSHGSVEVHALVGAARSDDALRRVAERFEGAARSLVADAVAAELVTSVRSAAAELRGPRPDWADATDRIRAAVDEQLEGLGFVVLTLTLHATETPPVAKDNG